MRIMMPAAAVLLVLFSCSTSGASEPDLEEGYYLYDGTEIIEANKCLVPEVVDWNNDGKKDLVAGQYDYGHVRLYINQGTDINPVFDGMELIEAGGVPITTSYY